jgi:hypothetical protein
MGDTAARDFIEKLGSAAKQLTEGGWRMLEPGCSPSASSAFTIFLCRWQRLVLGPEPPAIWPRPEGEMPIADLVTATGMKRNNLERLLNSMVKDGEVVRVGRGVYGPRPEAQ